MFDYGFRPFFLLAGLHAFAVMPVWLYFYAHHGAPFGSLPTMYWHSHEMLYGFVVAAIAGFMLTAVPSWTGTRGFGGVPLIVLVTLWLAGRVAMASVGSMPFWLVAIAELAFLPALAALLVPPLFRSGNRNMRLLVVLGALWLADAAFVVSLGSGNVALAGRATNFGINVVLILVTVIGGRIVPAFTANALRRHGDTVELISHAWLEKLVIGSMIAIAIRRRVRADRDSERRIGGNCGTGACIPSVGLAWISHSWRVHSLGAARRLCVAANRTRAQGAVAARRSVLRDEVAARARDGRVRDDDPRRHDARFARSYRPRASGLARHYRRVRTAHARGAGASVRRGVLAGTLSTGDERRRARVDGEFPRLSRRVHPDSRRTACGWEAGLNLPVHRSLDLGQ